MDGGKVSVARRNKASVDYGQRILTAWHTNNRATIALIASLPSGIWSSEIPGVPRKTVRTIAAHIHNARCRWIKSFSGRVDVPVPALVDLRAVRQRELLAALSRSGDRMLQLLEHIVRDGGNVPNIAWLNFPPDAAHFLSYFASHEAHHRGQLILVARQLGHPLPRDVSDGVWNWKKLSKEQPK